MKWGKTTTHILQQHQFIVTSWQCQPNIFDNKTFARQKSNLWIKLPTLACIYIYIYIHIWRLLRMAKSWRTGRASRSSASFHSFHKCLPSKPSRWVSLGVLYPHHAIPPSCSFDVQADVRWKMWLYNSKLEQAMRNLACGDQ